MLIDESMLGWGEFELEVMRDHADNVVIVCSIENIDPMGVHTGDSVTVAPQQTLSDRVYQKLRDQAIAVIRAVGVETGGSNVQFAVNPATEEIVVIEMNPRVSRSTALASKATGFPIAKIAARLAVGYTLDEIPNDIADCTSSVSSSRNERSVATMASKHSQERAARPVPPYTTSESGSSATAGSRLFIRHRSGASVCQLPQLSAFPWGARTGRAPAVIAGSPRRRRAPRAIRHRAPTPRQPRGRR